MSVQEKHRLYSLDWNFGLCVVGGFWKINRNATDCWECLTACRTSAKLMLTLTHMLFTTAQWLWIMGNIERRKLRAWLFRSVWINLECFWNISCVLSTLIMDPGSGLLMLGCVIDFSQNFSVHLCCDEGRVVAHFSVNSLAIIPFSFDSFTFASPCNSWTDGTVNRRPFPLVIALLPPLSNEMQGPLNPRPRLSQEVLAAFLLITPLSWQPLWEAVPLPGAVSLAQEASLWRKLSLLQHTPLMSCL